MGGTPFSGHDGGGVPHSRFGIPPIPVQVRTGGTPFPGQDREGALPLPLSVGWGTPPQSRSQVRRGGGTSNWNWNSMACTCYAVGGMPLAFTQEDFLLFLSYPYIRHLQTYPRTYLGYFEIFLKYVNLYNNSRDVLCNFRKENSFRSFLNEGLMSTPLSDLV